MNGKKVKTNTAGEITKYTRRLYPGDIWLTENPPKTRTGESQKQ